MFLMNNNLKLIINYSNFGNSYPSFKALIGTHTWNFVNIFKLVQTNLNFSDTKNLDTYFTILISETCVSLLRN